MGKVNVKIEGDLYAHDVKGMLGAIQQWIVREQFEHSLNAEPRLSPWDYLLPAKELPLTITLKYDPKDY